MKTIHILLGGLISIAVISCNSGIDQNTKSETPVQQTTGLTNLPSANAITPMVSSGDTGKPLVNTSVQNNVSTAVNPAHGQPGHKCDVSVGAPLSAPAANSVTSKAITPAAIPQAPVVNNSQIQTAAPAQKTTAGLNPAHGQPGHKCDISVGAPLTGNSTSSTTPLVAPSTTPPVTSSTTQPGLSSIFPASSNTPINQTTSLPAPQQVNSTPQIQNSPLNVPLPQATTSGQNSKVRLNPAHGQPGHDCSIPAGKPLKQ